MPNSIGQNVSKHSSGQHLRRTERDLGGNRVRGAAPVAIIAVIVVALIAAAAAWWLLVHNKQTAANQPTATSATSAQGTSATGAEPAAPVELTVDQIYAEARKAMADNRMVSPPGNNALEYYLKILEKRPDDSGAKDALRELFPFATAGVEDQINQDNMDEATRIMDLLAKADPSNYTLTILRSKMDAKRKQSERDLALKAQQEAAALAAAEAAKKAAETGTTAGTAEPTGAASGGQSAGGTSKAPAAAKAPEVATPTPAPTPVVPQGESREVRVVSAPRPKYPPAAARNRQSGWVEVEFTVAASGEVQNAHVTASQPARVFDREAVRAVEGAKFDPKLENGQPVASTLRRRIEFNLGE